MQENNFDPENCTLDELRARIDELEDIEEYYNTMQLSAKTFINSVYGYFGATFAALANIDIAESITLQGQDLIKFSVIEINDYMNNLWNQDYDGHKRIADKMRSIFGDKFNYDQFLELAKKNKIHLDTVQVYGDSVVGDSQISLADDSLMTIEELFNEGSNFEIDQLGKERVQSTRSVYCVDLSTGIIDKKPIKYVMRHKIGKQLYNVYNDILKINVICTEDHSILKYDGNFKEVKPTEISEYDFLIFKGKKRLCTYKGFNVSKANVIDGYVYDIEVDSDDDNYHNFFANGILVHNTDSVSKDTIIRSKLHPEGITIEEFYNENSANKGEDTRAGHESVHTTDQVLNFNGSILKHYSNIYYGNVKRIIRHKVSKPKWTITTFLGHSVSVTDDHSLMVLRNDKLDKKLYKVKPSEVKPGDDAMSLEVMYGDIIEGSDRIISCIRTGDYNDEYVYDIEMDDDNHTFFANDILVHNSAYITLQPLIDACNIPLEQQLEFDLAFYDEVLEGYMDIKFDEYAKKNHCKQNLEKFELEKISRTIIMLAKKNYMCDVEWIDSGARFEPLEHITYTGYDVVKGSTPDYCRQEMKNFVNFVMDILNNGRKPTLGEIVTKLREIKKRFSMQNPNDISKSTSISNYENFILDDKGKELIFQKNKVERDEKGNITKVLDQKLPVPIHVRAAAVYNHMLFNKAKKYKSKYSLLKSGDKVKFYYTSGDDVFGFVPDLYPMEFAPAMDIDTQFEKMLLSPLNRIIVAMGYSEIPPTLAYTPSLF